MPDPQKTMFDALTCDPLDLIDQLGDDADTRRWPARLHQLFELHRHYNTKRAGMDEDDASIDARDRCILIGDYLGGRGFIIPRGDALRQALRDKCIWLAYTGHNHEELAGRFGLHITHVYRILREQRALFKAKQQGRLFTDD